MVSPKNFYHLILKKHRCWKGFNNCRRFTNLHTRQRLFAFEGEWVDFNSDKKYKGGQWHSITLSLDDVPLFVKNNTILPLAEPVPFVSPQTQFSITCRVYGKPASAFQLFEENSRTNDCKSGMFSWLQLSWNGKTGAAERKGAYTGRLYKVVRWQQMSTP